MKLVTVEQRGAVAVLRMERTEALNALDDALATDLLAAVEAAGRDPEVGAVVVTGSGRAFCAGGDLRWLADYDGPDSGEPMRQLTKLFDPMAIELRRMPKAVVAAVYGVAAGAGLSLALCADFRVAARSAFFRVAYGNIAVAPDGGLTWLLPRIVGRQVAARLSLVGGDVDADEALRLGLVDEVVPADTLLERAVAVAAEMAAIPAPAFGMVKRAVRAPVLERIEALAAEHDPQVTRMWQHPETVAAIARYLDATVGRAKAAAERAGVERG